MPIVDGLKMAIFTNQRRHLLCLGAGLTQSEIQV
jgi:hypothetical protein